ncbi:MAG: hypothetical protein V4649_17415 [Bacteroidota bacterium]
MKFTINANIAYRGEALTVNMVCAEFKATADGSGDYYAPLITTKGKIDELIAIVDKDGSFKVSPSTEVAIESGGAQPCVEKTADLTGGTTVVEETNTKA